MTLHRLDAAEALAAEQRLSFMLEPRLLRGVALITQAHFRMPLSVCDKGTKPGGLTRAAHSASPC